MALFDGGGFFSNTSNPRTNTTTSTATTNNASYGAGSPVNLNLSNLSQGKYGRVDINPTITLSDHGAIAAALNAAQQISETSSNNALTFAETARQAASPISASLENMGKYITVAIVAGVLIWKLAK